MPSADEMAAGAAVFSGLAADLQADLGDGAAAAGVATIRADDDEEEDEDEEHGGAAAAADVVNDAPDFGTQKTVLQAARTLIDVWFDSSDLEPLKLPTCLSVDDRGVLHAYCENLRRRRRKRSLSRCEPSPWWESHSCRWQQQQQQQHLRG